MINRQEVYKAIDGERDYQDNKWNCSTTSSCGVHSPTEWLVFMEHYIQQAKAIVSTEAEPQASQKALDIIRKVGGMAVACMEQNGVVKRK
jgi:hypothetical protein